MITSDDVSTVGHDQVPCRRGRARRGAVNDETHCRRAQVARWALRVTAAAAGSARFPDGAVRAWRPPGIILRGGRQASDSV